MRAIRDIFQDIEGVAMMLFHAHRAQNGTHGSRSPALFANDLADVSRSDAQAKDAALFVPLQLHFNGIRFIDQGTGNFYDEIAHWVLLPLCHNTSLELRLPFMLEFEDSAGRHQSCKQHMNYSQQSPSSGIAGEVKNLE